ncbi:phosphoglycerate dehydrogenase-like enzyme [Bradyrhizobium japonicum]
MRALFVDANDTLAAVTEKLLRGDSLPVGINRNPAITPDDLPRLLDGVEIMIVDHTAVPTAIAAKCPALKHVVFLGTGARSYMNPEELGQRGISVHTIKGYGDTAVAECAIALMWASAKSFGERWIAACARAIGCVAMRCSSPARRSA